MRKARHRLLLLASIAIALVLVAGCGSDEKTAAPPAELEEQLGFGDAGIVERQSRVEGRIQACMKAQGFDYVPVDPLAQKQAVTGRARISDEEFIEQFGLGISTLFGRGGAQADPNDRIRKNLSGADRAAYDRALFGDSPGLTFAEAIDNDAANELGGCTREATEAVFGGAEVLVSLQGKLDELDERIIQDQRMVRAIEKWSGCMSDDGFQYIDPEQIDTDLLKRFQAIIGEGVRPGATTTPTRGTTYDRAALADLKRDEVAVANADLDCEERHITPVEEEVRPQYEETFRKENRKLLTRIRPVGQ